MGLSGDWVIVETYAHTSQKDNNFGSKKMYGRTTLQENKPSKTEMHGRTSLHFKQSIIILDKSFF